MTLWTLTGLMSAAPAALFLTAAALRVRLGRRDSGMDTLPVGDGSPSAGAPAPRA